MKVELEGYKKLLETIWPYASLSGTSLNQFGMFETCLRNGYYYSSLKIEMDPIPSYYGLCHSIECTTNDFNDEELQSDFKELINSTGFLDKYNVSIDDADFIFYDPLTYRKDQGIMFTFTLFLIGMFLILSCFNPVFCQMMKFKRQAKVSINLSDVESRERHDENLGLTNNEITTIKQEETKKSFFIDYSIKESYNTLFSFKEHDTNLSIMEGFRSLGFLMVIFGHQFLDLAKSSFQYEMLAQLKSWLCLNLVNMLYSVDMFFWLGGFFSGFMLIEKNKMKLVKKNGLSIFGFLLHRILRIWPCYAIAILISSQLVPYMGDGPRWFMALDRFECATGWRNLIFIDNLFYDTQYCFPWGWYLSTDMQLFTSCLIPVFLYAKLNSRAAKIVIISLLVITQTIGTVMSFVNEYLLPPFALTQPKMHQNYYTKPFTRGPPYYLGFLLGVLYRELKENNVNVLSKLMGYASKRQLKFKSLCYLLGFLIIGGIWFGWRPAQLHYEHQDYWNKTIQSLWFAFCRLGIALGMSFLSLPCLFGMQDLFNLTFMRNNYFRFINKISFSGYLLHQVIIFGVLGQFYQTPNFSFETIFTLYIGNVFITIICSILFQQKTE
ncbi:unnamed protein product (macronuclear) [Paramecium tetraurelia]|uniref:Acyltransferase 3 domain-containing protein n=1 Tax=Paramecium tetraurelia TaxID=5888 RepID=A0DL44_PARTE|nr:uncharacterized protein GSPATT00018078001 [Paramecium tetraurelia]CAK83761.1 unnamed protein product [Paramecium tetraurelia]|eukprot:XP_001451158.1 hypothetical protein (macronuclear) [Paramecium tetraurelia strain d4-2]